MTPDSIDVRLVERAQAGDSTAFAAIYDDLAPRLLRFLAHRVRNADSAEELMQRTFVKMIEALPRFRPRDGVPFRAWAFRIARNVLIDAERTDHPAQSLDLAPDPPAADPGPEALAEAAVERAELRRAIDRLPPHERDVIVYRFFGELTPHEVAPIVHRSDGAVRVLQHRALQHLRRMLIPSMPERVATQEAGL